MYLSKDDRKNQLSEKEYNEKLTVLLERYTHKNTVLFNKVTELDSISSQIGIYILCLPEFKGYYIGKTTNSLKRRITNHWLSPKSDFDKLYNQEDVKEIYVMYCNELDDYIINELEIDCIATIGRKFALNCLFGGDYLISLRDEIYDEKTFSVSEEFLEELKELLLKINLVETENIKNRQASIKVRNHQATTYEEYLGAVKDNYNNLFYVPVEFRDEQICLEAIYYHWYSKKPSFLSNSQKYIYDFLGLIPKESYTDEFVKQLIIELTGNGFTNILFEFLPLDSISFENLIFTVDCDIDSLDYIPSKYRTQDFYNQISKLDGKLFSKISAEFLTKEVYINLVGALPVNIKKVPESYLDREFYVSAIKQNPSVLKYIPNSVIDNDIIETSLSIDSSVIRFVDSKNPDYPKYAFDSVKDDWKNLKYIPCEFRTKEMMDIVSPFGKRALKYFCEVSK